MGRPPDPERRDALLDDVARYVLRFGLADLSLRPLAKTLRTSPRMLLYHFGSKEELLGQALGRIRLWEREAAGEWLSAGDGESSPAAVLERAWRWLSSEEARPFMRLFFEVYGLALQTPTRHAAFLDRVVADWLPLARALVLRAGVPPHEADDRATLLIATQRGLLLDLLATGDAQRVDAAHARMIRELTRPRAGATAA